MTDDELLAKAKREYPPGTIHSGAMAGNTRYTIPNHAEYYMNDGSVYVKDKSGCIYWKKNNYWAVIISRPKQKGSRSLLKLYKIN